MTLVITLHGISCMQQISCLPCTVTDKVYGELLCCRKETFCGRANSGL